MGKIASDATIERVHVLMQDGKARTSKQAAGELSIAANTVNAAFARLHKRKQLHIGSYVMDPTGHNWVRVFLIGNEKDAVKPSSEKKHSHEYQRREREFLRESRATASKIFRHPWDIWLFGECAAPPNTKWNGRVIKQSMSIQDEELEAA